MLIQKIIFFYKSSFDPTNFWESFFCQGPKFFGVHCSFNILSTVSGMIDPVQTIIKLNVKKCTTESLSASESENAKLLSTLIQGATAATVLLSFGVSLTNLSLLVVLWSAINQMQILNKLDLLNIFLFI